MAKTLLKTKRKTVPLDRYSGKWVALIDNRVVAWADTLKDLAKKIKGMGLKKKPVYFLVPRKDEGPYIFNFQCPIINEFPMLQFSNWKRAKISPKSRAHF